MAGIMGGPGFRQVFRTAAAIPYGPGAFKIDWALSEPIPWKARECLEAATVHVGGTLEEITAAEAAPWRGECGGASLRARHPAVGDR
jgi:phytoene dehydrogenase-like protein